MCRVKAIQNRPWQPGLRCTEFDQHFLVGHAARHDEETRLHGLRFRRRLKGLGLVPHRRTSADWWARFIGRRCRCATWHGALAQRSNHAIAAQRAGAFHQRAIDGCGNVVLPPAWLALDDGAFYPATRAEGGLVALQQPVAAVDAATGLAGDANGAGGGFVAVQALAAAENIHALAHGLPRF